MTYIISDIHGCYTEFRELLDRIGFCDDDELFVLGDAMDRGAEPIKVIQDLMRRPNVTYILGNHDDMMLQALKKLTVDVTEFNLENLTDDVFISYFHWLQEGGEVTAEQFRKLSHAKRRDILDYLENAMPYEMIEHDSQLYILVHAGIQNFDPMKELDEYDYTDFLWERLDYTRRYFPSARIFLVTGHTPTALINENKAPLVYMENGHIAIDCGCVFGGNLAAYCIETGRTTYIPSRKSKRVLMDRRHVENIAYDLIVFLKKWNLWDSVNIFCNGKRYSSHKRGECTQGFRYLTDVYVSKEECPEELYSLYYESGSQGVPLLVISYDGTRLSELLTWGNYRTELHKLSVDALRYVIKAEDLEDEIKCHYKAHPILDDTEFYSRKEFLELESELVEEAVLEELKWRAPYRCGRKVVEAIEQELQSIMDKHGISSYCSSDDNDCMFLL